MIDEGTNSYDDPAGNIDPNDIRSTRNGGSLIGPPVNVPGVDDPTEKESPPPYSAPLRGIQVRVRQYETSTRQVRETTVSQDFMPE